MSELAREKIEHFEEGVPFPYFWHSESLLHEAAELVRPLVSAEVTALASIVASGTAGGLRLVHFAAGSASIRRLEPAGVDSALSPILTRLWYDDDLELGMEGVDDLALPSRERPLVTGHSKARLAAISELANARSLADLSELLLALRDPANAGEQWSDVRRALYRAITWFDVPAVWEAVLDGLRSEDPDTRSLLEYLLWRLEGLAQERSAELADARAVRV